VPTNAHTHTHTQTHIYIYIQIYFKFLVNFKKIIKLRKKLIKCYIWSIVLYGAETWTISAVDQKHLEILKCGAGKGLKRSVGLIT